MRPLRLLLPLALAACNDTENPTEDNENEVITTVALAFTPQEGGAPVEARWADPENDGDPVIDPVDLAAGLDYDLAVSFLNELADPPEDITEEVAAESDQHQVFFTGTTVGPVVTHAYADEDANGLPVGLASTISAVAPGSGTFIVTLRHLPPEGGVAVKDASLADQVASDGFDAIPGTTDAQVTFELTVPPGS